MISDVLYEARTEINSYLEEPTFDEVYKGDLRKRIIELRDRMEELQDELDSPEEAVKEP